MNILKLSNLYNDSCNNLVKNAQEIFQAKVYFWLEKCISELIDELNFINKDNYNTKLHKLFKTEIFEKDGIDIPINFILEFDYRGNFVHFNEKSFTILIQISTNYRQIIQNKILNKDKYSIMDSLRSQILDFSNNIVSHFYKKMEYINPKINKRFKDYYNGLIDKKTMFFKQFKDKNLFKNNPQLFSLFKAYLKEDYNVEYIGDDYNEDSLKDAINKFYNSETAKMFSEKERKEFIDKLIIQDDIYHKAMMQAIIKITEPDFFKVQDLAIKKMPSYELNNVSREKLPINKDIIWFLNGQLRRVDKGLEDLSQTIINPITLDAYFKRFSKENLEDYLINEYIRSRNQPYSMEAQPQYFYNIKGFKPIATRIIREFIKLNQNTFDKIDKLIKLRKTEENKKR